MRTDPRKACANADERLFWALLHDLVAHPLMAVTCWAGWAVKFHDYTSQHAWPRVSATPQEVVRVAAWHGTVTCTQLGDDVWSVQHPKVQHAFVTNAKTAWGAAKKAEAWFEILADEFGGVFNRPAAQGTGGQS